MSVRSARPDDAAAIQAIYAREVLEGFATFEVEPPDVVEMRGRMEAILPAFPWLVWEDAEAGVGGFAYASRHKDRAAYRWSVDATVYVTPQRQGRGVGRALYKTLFDILRRQGFRAAYAGVTRPNAASEGLHQAFGFELVGIYRDVGCKFGRWHDTSWWRKSLNPLPGNPPEPIPYAELGVPPEIGPS